MHFILILFISILFPKNNPCDHYILDKEAKIGRYALTDQELEIYELAYDLCEEYKAKNPFQSSGSFSSMPVNYNQLGLSLGTSISHMFGISLLTDSDDYGYGDYNLMTPYAISIELDNVPNVGGGIEYRMSNYSGATSSTYTNNISSNAYALYLFFQADRLRGGIKFAAGNLKWEVDYHDDWEYPDGDTTTQISATIVSPYIGINHKFENNKLGLELRNYFDFYYYDDPDYDYQRILTSQTLILKFYL